MKARLQTAHRVNYVLECFPAGTTFAEDGTPSCAAKWIEDINNLVPTVGLNDILDKYWKGSTYTAAFYVGLISATPTIAAGDTMASHAGWTEITAYDEAARQALTLGTVSGGSVNNSASRAVFTMDASQTVGGAFISTVSTKGDNTGVLASAAAFNEGNRGPTADGDIIRVTATITATSA